MWTQFDVGCGFSKQRKRPAPRSTSHDSRIAHSPRQCGVGRTRGVGRGLGVTLGVAVGDGVGLGVGVGPA